MITQPYQGYGNTSHVLQLNILLDIKLQSYVQLIMLLVAIKYLPPSSNDSQLVFHLQSTSLYI